MINKCVTSQNIALLFNYVSFCQFSESQDRTKGRAPSSVPNANYIQEKNETDFIERNLPVLLRRKESAYGTRLGREKIKRN